MKSNKAFHKHSKLLLRVQFLSLNQYRGKKSEVTKCCYLFDLKVSWYYKTTIFTAAAIQCMLSTEI